MQLITYAQAGSTRLGAVEDGIVIDLNRAYAALLASLGVAGPAAQSDAELPSDVLAFLRLGEPAVERAGRAVTFAREAATPGDQLTLALGDVRLLPPIPQPPKIICVARNYAKHAKEAGLEISEIPILFTRFANTLVASGDPVIRPTVSEQFDWEGELAVVIGRGGRHISRESAMDHVAGYTIFNDVTVRDYQFRVTQYTAGKNFAASGPMGPFLTLKHAIGDPHALDLVTDIDGETVQSANTADMIFDIPHIIEHVAEFIDLEPGDVIPMGTPEGVGFKRNPPRFLQPGQTVTVSIPGLGSLVNPVVAEEELS